jgi:hypothetical protein
MFYEARMPTVNPDAAIFRKSLASMSKQANRDSALLALLAMLPPASDNRIGNHE